MPGIARVNDGLGETVSLLRRSTEALFQAAILVGLACVIGLIVAGTYGIIHNGDDFSFNNNNNFGSVRDGGDGGGGGDVVVLPSGLF